MTSSEVPVRPRAALLLRARRLPIAAALTLSAVACSAGESLQRVPPPEAPAQQPASEPPSLEQTLAGILSAANARVVLGLTQAWAPPADDSRRFPFFVAHNEARWRLPIDRAQVAVATLYEYSSRTEEGGEVHEYLSFGDDGVTWWFDGREDAFAEFEDPVVRCARVSRLFLAVHDGVSGWAPIDASARMPVDHGLAIGIELEDGSLRYW